jgi:hypothetical protein
VGCACSDAPVLASRTRQAMILLRMREPEPSCETAVS